MLWWDALVIDSFEGRSRISWLEMLKRFWIKRCFTKNVRHLRLFAPCSHLETFLLSGLSYKNEVTPEWWFVGYPRMTASPFGQSTETRCTQRCLCFYGGLWVALILLWTCRSGKAIGVSLRRMHAGRVILPKFIVDIEIVLSRKYRSHKRFRWMMTHISAYTCVIPPFCATSGFTTVDIRSRLEVFFWRICPERG